MYFLKINQLDSALIKLNKHIKQKSTQNPNEYDHFNNNRYLANIYLEKGIINKASSSLVEAEKVYPRINSNLDKANYHIVSGRVLAKKGLYQFAIKELNQAMDLAITAQSTAIQMLISKHLSEVNLKIKDF